ncbi:cell division inhibitor SulA [Serratia fonticola]|uniref:Cell division inhibitor SulA n=2 Tax=Serratia fonticola TaxID=47917 RepID=A0A4U9V2Z3_SERFO|nr:cell division inhibitor SulA [Serratia fonticola]
MRTQSLYQPHFSQSSMPAKQAVIPAQEGNENGLISELVYNERQPA